MFADFTSSQTPLAPLQVLAQAYGTSSYNSNTYNGQPTTGQTSVPLPPNTGVLLHSPLVDLGLLILLGVLIGTLSFLLRRALRRRSL